MTYKALTRRPGRALGSSLRKGCARAAHGGACLRTGAADSTVMHLMTDENSRHGLLRRFNAKVERGVGCWIWTAAKARFGHGLFHVSGNQLMQAHRVAWVIAHGPIPAGMGVLHHCDQPACVRPDHLFLGTQRDNVLDMLQKGRGHYQRKAAS